MPTGLSVSSRIQPKTLTRSPALTRVDRRNGRVQQGSTLRPREAKCTWDNASTATKGSEVHVGQRFHCDQGKRSARGTTLPLRPREAKCTWDNASTATNRRPTCQTLRLYLQWQSQNYDWTLLKHYRQTANATELSQALHTKLREHVVWTARSESFVQVSDKPAWPTDFNFLRFLSGKVT